MQDYDEDTDLSEADKFPEGRTLAKRVAVWDPEVGRRIKFEPGEILPPEYLDKVTNPALFVNEQAVAAAEQAKEDASWHKGMTIPKLKIIAEDEGVDLDGWTKKADIIGAIDAHRAANPSEGDEEDFTGG